MFLIASEIIAKHVSDEDIQKGSLYPPLSLIRECSFDIAIGITKYAYAKGKVSFLGKHVKLMKSFLGLASLYPEPSDKKSWLKQHIYNFNYQTSMPVTWPWPEMPHIATRPLEPLIIHDVKK